MSRLRTFIAVDPGKAIRDRLVALQDALARAGAEVKWVGPDNLHVTLLFLGEVVDKDVPSVCRVVREVAGRHAPFTMSVEKTGCFPSVRRPRILWVGVGQGAAELSALHDDLEQPLLDLGCYRREERRFTPHITLGRNRKEGSHAELAAALVKKSDWKAGEIAIHEILVMSSELTSEGPEYTVLSRAPCGAG